MADPAVAVAVRAPVRPGRLDGFVWSMALSQTVSWGVLYYAFSVLLVPMQRDLGWSRTVLVGGFTVAVVVSGLLAPAVGRSLDRGSARLLMGAGSAAAVALVVAWSRTNALAAYYVVWAGIGVAMALVLYEAAFTVVAKRSAPHHHRALTTVTLVAGTSSFFFQPLTSALVSAHGWRTALVVLAAVLGAATLPVHLGVLPGAHPGVAPAGPAHSSRRADGPFWALTAAFTGASIASFGTSVLLVAYLVDHGWHLGSAAVAAGFLGVMQLPGRLLLVPVRARFGPAPLVRVMLALPAAGVLLLLISGGGPAVWPAAGILGMSQGLNTLLRVTLLADIYGTATFGTLNGLSATPVVLARALSPLGAAYLAAASGGYVAPFLILAATAGASSVVAGRRLESGGRPSRSGDRNPTRIRGH